MTRRFPAEWEEQDGVLLAWPHESTDWRLHLDLVEPVFTEIVRSISRFERVILVVPDELEVERRLADAGAEMANVRLFPVESNDTWARDFGPVTVTENGQPLLLDFGFNGWGLKFPADLDNLITGRLCQLGAFRAERQIVGLIMEGGSLESDGSGTILTTAECLLSPNRNPHLSRLEIEAELARKLGTGRVLWLENGYLAGDDTDSHVDTLARLCPDDTIVYQACDDPADEHYGALSAMADELAAFRTRDGHPYRLLPLPWPEARFDDDGQRLPATYANFLIINRALLVPTYGDKNDGAALAVIRSAFPDREVIGIDCSPLILQHGSLHCVTMQLPKGVLS
ncbi:agmatine/peptidylarginine deiminase [Geobacter sp. AOG1]|uniref:agmatine deiminase family protein n=1 Tax=Geobacter sp. AOG1 TaxID=1566346 RepID=UPI001CC4A065|nr:agmatine deiminase family protein [Geobacter sp. AOG1]GFE58056.1 agmatine deiminase [Geobacter sp. AOG1]